MLGHPSRTELMEYAESLVDYRASISSTMAAHVAQCPSCASEVEGMRACFAIAAHAEELEPSVASNITIMLAAQKGRQTLARRRHSRRRLVALGKGLAFAAGLAMVMTVAFGAFLDTGAKPVSAASPKSALRTQLATLIPSPEAIRKATAQVQTLAAALEGDSDQPQTLWEQQHRRAVEALGADIEEARAALERNPGCGRAATLIHRSLERQALTYRRLYAGIAL